jgi:hypothetical protein
VVYLGATLSGARVLSGRPRALAVLSFVEVAVVAAFCGWMVLLGLLVAGLGALARPDRAGGSDRPGGADRAGGADRGPVSCPAAASTAP